MTEMRECSIDAGRICGANNGRRVLIGGRMAIVLHNYWVDISTGEHHQVGLDFQSDPQIAEGDASPECQQVLRKVFSDLDDAREWVVTDEYLASLPEIYRDIFAIYPVLEPQRGFGDGLAFQTLFLGLQEKYSLGAITSACEQLAAGGAMLIRARMFACPTKLGEEIILRLTGRLARSRQTLPPFSPPPVESVA